MPDKSQEGIKSWKHCTRCGWAGKANDLDLALTQCPNCTNPSLSVDIDEEVFAGKRYPGERIRSSKDQAAEDAARQGRGDGVAPADTDDKSNRGYQYPA